ncbi:hypothetical protein GCM10009564_54610 [Streptomyces thermogriseus]|uniref:Uncharacterized protein n=1 Tax=Streptomyces thermogriseus TaxID=75292 RepID=A0ABP4DTF5_9ACTN
MATEAPDGRPAKALGHNQGSSADTALTFDPSFAATVEVVAAPERVDVDRRGFLATVPFAAVAGIGPSRDRLWNTLDQKPEPGPRMRLEDVTTVKNMSRPSGAWTSSRAAGRGAWCWPTT